MDLPPSTDGGDNLESLFIHAKIRHPFLEESLFSPRFWPKLRSAVLGILPASADDLDVLTRSLSSHPEGSLSLSSVHLYCGGTWASILDMLRDRRIHASLGYQCSETTRSLRARTAEAVIERRSLFTIFRHLC
jgi:hypothetical protein